MSAKGHKQYRKTVKKAIKTHTLSVVDEFLSATRVWPFAARLKLAWGILCKRRWAEGEVSIKNEKGGIYGTK